MSSRPLMVATLLGASIGVPYVMSHTSSKSTPGPATPPAASPFYTPSNPTWNPSWGHPSAPPTPAALAPPLLDSATPVEGARFHSLAEVFRFDVSREWVYQNWGRKSTGLGDPARFGVRVPLVTGTGMTDLAGALTYHFNNQGQVEHISFRGRTADTTALLQFLTTQYKFTRMEAPPGEQLYQVRSGKLVYSEFRSRPEGVLWSNSPHGSFGVVVELQRPGLNRPLVPQTPKLEIPQVATTTPTAPADTSAEGADAKADEEPALVGKLRPATPADEGQRLRGRWPN